jgi:hypothetical protein
MKITTIAQTVQKKLSLITSVAVMAVTPMLAAMPVGASQITGRSVTLSNSAGAATGVSYALVTAAVPTATAVKSVQIQFCTSASGACTTPTGFSASTSTLASQPTGLGATSGWTVNTATAGSLRIVNASNATVPTGAVTINWAGVTNPTANNTTFYGVVTTYSDSAWTTPLDTGTVALSTATQIQVALTVSEALTFCAGTSITGQNCGSIAGNTVNLGVGSTTTASTGGNLITANTSNAASSVGTKQFGLNLVSNSAPTVGSAVTGIGTGVAATNYNTTNSFRFGTGETVATVAVPTNANAYTVSYVANIDGVTPPGSYNTNLTYVATANF